MPHPKHADKAMTTVDQVIMVGADRRSAREHGQGVHVSGSSDAQGRGGCSLCASTARIGAERRASE